MRLLHTADWHLVNTMHNVDRRKEQEAFLLWLAQVVKDEDFDDVVAEIKEVSELLRHTKGLGNLYVGGGFRNLLSVALVLSSYAKSVTESQTGTALNSIINTIIAGQMMTIACTVAPVSLATASSSS